MPLLFDCAETSEVELLSGCLIIWNLQLLVYFGIFRNL